MRYSRLFIAGTATLALGGCFTLPPDPVAPQASTGYTAATTYTIPTSYTGATGNTGATGYTGMPGYDWIHGRGR